MIPTVTAHSGLTLPVIGFGTYTLKGREGAETVARAIDNGYTLIDSAFNYENEGAVGAGVRLAGRDRSEVIVTSKLPGRRQRHDEALVTIEESVYRTGLDYLDLYLIHWPNPITDHYVEAWTAMVEARQRGLVRAIGVCNFLPDQLDRLGAETGVLPEVNQIELHPYFPQAEQLGYDADHGIITEAWSPLGRGREGLLADQVVVALADRYDTTPGQLVLAWAITRGAVPLPKASGQQRQLENLAAAELALDDADVAALTALGRPDGRIDDQDPAVYEEF
ncbi:aldo/keto reductase [Micropruina sonneratiae]|uniref:aldo/keto reductase n=1 Tax=Micropruina sonneratiae TaxID=2986940 RepID=UPI002227B53A|nr:aldo/keto reductase [Micropruina sp. KQZ13P-5]MCW3157010.1 aldo/keto reductase [Micropruina sp. KQZ13P-5]